MSSHFELSRRFSKFQQRFTKSNLLDTSFLIYLAGWFFFFLLLVYGRGGFVIVFYHIAHAICWFVTIDYLQKRLEPPGEILAAFLFLIYGLEAGVLNVAYRNPDGLMAGPFGECLHAFLLSLLFLTLSLLVIRSTRGHSKRVLVGLGLLTLVGIEMAKDSGFVPLLVLQLVIFVFLLRRTYWLESLTKAECWLSLAAVFIVFRGVHNWDPFVNEPSSFFRESNLWFGLPWFLMTTFKLYLLALLVKIPVVLVYNFASLRRKLKISSLFQSTVPQVIQAAMLILIFYFFLAGFQAEKVRKSIFDTIELIADGEQKRPDFWVELKASGTSLVELPGYESFELTSEFPHEGILLLNRTDSGDYGPEHRDHFVFASFDADSDLGTVYFVRIDPSYIEMVARNTSLLVGSRLLAYPYQQPNWENYLLQVTSRVGFQLDNRRFHILPVGFTPEMSTDPVIGNLGPFGLDQSELMNEFDKFIQFGAPALGRVLTPVLTSNLQEKGYFAFDIVVLPSAGIFTSSLISYALLLALIYAVLNFAVTRRIVTFGEEINKMIVQKFNQLRDGIREISTGNLDYKVEIEGRDEFVELAERFNQMGDRLKDSIAEVREKERLAHELAIARQVQLDLLPRSLPEVPGFEIAATMQTANEVGGDFYDVIPLAENRFLFTIGDVSGKGTSAAFYMAQFISLLRFSPGFTEKTDEIAIRLNRYFSSNEVDRQIYVTAIIGILDAAKNTIHFVRAGHTLPFLVPAAQNAKVTELKIDGLGIGIERSGSLFEQTVKVKTVRLEKGDSVVFYTDGVEEAARKNGSEEYEYFGSERLFSTFSDSRTKQAEDAIQQLQNNLKSFYRTEPLVDDYTVLVVRRKLDS